MDIKNPKHIALIILPDQTIMAIPGLSEPSKPMHSGYIDEERSIMNAHRKEWREYRKDAERGILCDTKVANSILDTQHPNRKKNWHIPLHFNVINTSMEELCGERALEYKPKVTLKEHVDCEDKWYGR